jgi:hypothetical protein
VSASTGGGRGGATGGGARAARLVSPRLTRRNSTVRSDSTDSIVGDSSISSSWRIAIRSVPSSATQNSLRRPSATTTPRAPPDNATRTSSSIGHGRIDARARDVEAQALELGGEARRQRIVVGQRQQHDAPVRRRAGLGRRPHLARGRATGPRRPPRARARDRSVSYGVVGLLGVRSVFVQVSGKLSRRRVLPHCRLL